MDNTTRTVSEVQYIPRQSRVLMMFREGSTQKTKWIKAKGESALLAAVATVRAAFLERGWEVIA